MAEEYKISLGVKLDTEDIKTQIENTKIDKIKVRLDTEGIKTDIDKIKSQIESLNDIKINLGSGGASGSTGISKTINKDIASVKASVNNGKSYVADLRRALSNLKFDRSSIDLITKDINKIGFAVKEVSHDISNNRLRLNVKGIERDIDGVERAITVVKEYNRAGQYIGGNTRISQQFDDGTAAIKEFNRQAEKARKIQIDINTGKFNNDISKMESEFNKLANQSSTLRAALNNVKAAHAAMVTASNANNIEDIVAANERYEEALKYVNNQLKINARQEKNNIAAQKLIDEKNVFRNKIDAWLKDNSAAAKKFGGTLTELKSRISSCDAVTLNHLKNQFKEIDKQAEAAGLKSQTFSDRLQKQFERYSSYISVASAMIYVTQCLRNMFEQVVAIDSAMTELKKVTDETNSTYDNFLTTASQKAQQIGTTIDNYISSTADFARLGYDFSEAANLSEVANVYTVVGDEIDSIDDATNSIISTMKAFKVEANDSINIVDKFNEVSKLIA